MKKVLIIFMMIVMFGLLFAQTNNKMEQVFVKGTPVIIRTSTSTDIIVSFDGVSFSTSGKERERFLDFITNQISLIDESKKVDLYDGVYRKVISCYSSNGKSTITSYLILTGEGYIILEVQSTTSKKRILLTKENLVEIKSLFEKSLQFVNSVSDKTRKVDELVSNSRNSFK